MRYKVCVMSLALFALGGLGCVSNGEENGIAVDDSANEARLSFSNAPVATADPNGEETLSPDELLREDRMQIRESLSTMDRRERALVRTRMDIVEGSGISGIGNNDAPQPGDPAPDFALSPLKFYDFQIDETPITEENAGLLYQAVQLSSFKGSKPVVLIFGSYT